MRLGALISSSSWSSSSEGCALRRSDAIPHPLSQGSAAGPWLPWSETSLAQKWDCKFFVCGSNILTRSQSFPPVNRITFCKINHKFTPQNQAIRQKFKSTILNQPLEAWAFVSKEHRQCSFTERVYITSEHFTMGSIAVSYLRSL